MAIVLTINNTTVFWQYDWLLDRSRGLHALRFTLYVWRSPPLLHVSLLRFYAVRFCACTLCAFTLYAFRFTLLHPLSRFSFVLLCFTLYAFALLRFALYALRFTLYAYNYSDTRCLTLAVCYSLSLYSLFYTGPLTLTLYYSLSYLALLCLLSLHFSYFPFLYPHTYICTFLLDNL